MRKEWQGKIHGREERIVVEMTRSDRWVVTLVERQFKNDNYEWSNCDHLDEHTPQESTYDIWVATFADRSQILIEYWRDDDNLNIAYRGVSFNSWGPPARLTAMVDQ